jgi:hypothetical protein
VGPRVGQDILEQRKISHYSWDSSPGLFNLFPSHFADYISVAALGGGNGSKFILTFTPCEVGI